MPQRTKMRLSCATGWSLIELLISTLLGGMLVLLFVSGWVLSYHTFRQTHQFSELHYHAQFVHSFFQQELVNQSFWAGIAIEHIQSQDILSPQPDCQSPLDSGSIPRPSLPYFPIFSGTVGSNLTLSCLTQAKNGSDFLQLKRLAGHKLTRSTLRTNRLYLEQARTPSRFVHTGSRDLTTDADYWPYVHQVFYVAEQQVQGNTIPVLMRKRLVRQASGQLTMDTSSVVDGVEMMVFEFGVDQNFDGQTDFFVPANHIDAAVWQQQQGRIVQLRYFVLVRSRLADPTYTNRQRYQLGLRHFTAPADHFRRMLLSSAVSFHQP